MLYDAERNLLAIDKFLVVTETSLKFAEYFSYIFPSIQPSTDKLQTIINKLWSAFVTNKYQTK